MFSRNPQDAAHDGYIVLATDGSTFHVKPANAGSYSVVEAEKDEVSALERALRDWESRGGACGWTPLSLPPSQGPPVNVPTERR